MKLFIDTNVLLDVILERDDYENAARIMSLPDTSHGIKLYASILSMANIAYITRRNLQGNSFYQMMNNLSLLISVLPMNKNTLRSAISLRAKDFEDALQYICAKETNCDILITRNKKDFNFSEIPVLTPLEFLQKQGVL